MSDGDAVELRPVTSYGDDDAPLSPLDVDIVQTGAHGKHGFWSAVFNFVNSIVGAGIIGLAFGLKESGFWFGLILLNGVAFLTGLSVHVLVQCGDAIGRCNYESLAYDVLGDLGFVAVTGGMGSFAYSGMISYLMIMADSIPVVVAAAARSESPFFGPQFRAVWVIVIAVCLCLPPSSLKDMGILGRTSAFSIFCVLGFSLIIVFDSALNVVPHLPVDDVAYAHAVRFDFVHTNFFSAIGIFTFAYVCQHCSYLVRNTLREPSAWPRVNATAILIASALCCLLSITGFQSYGRCTRDNLLNNLPPSDAAASVARLLLAITMFLTYPMEFFVARHAIQSCVRRIKATGTYKRAFGGNVTIDALDDPATNTEHWAITAVLFVATVLPASVLHQDQLHIVLELAGGFAAVLIGFVVPSMLYIRLRIAGRRRLNAEAAPGAVTRVDLLLKKDLVEAWGNPQPIRDVGMGTMFAVGIVALLASTTNTLYDAVSKGGHHADVQCCLVGSYVYDPVCQHVFHPLNRTITPTTWLE